jgi:D-cysteine desulfhydrase family pyridoxal phosphate-dependent enzyme
MNRRDFMTGAVGVAGVAGLAAGCSATASGRGEGAMSDRIDLPREAMLGGPTPLEHLPRLSEALGGPQLYVKRDDLTPTGMGGNKIRKLEYLVAEARRQGADTLVTVGGVQSNHCRQTAAAAARFGLACELVLSRTAKSGSPLYMRSGNFALGQLYGARAHVLGEDDDREETAEALVARLREAGARPMLIGAGGSDVIGSMGYRRAAHELLDQLDEEGLSPRALYHATGSAGTQTGLVYGLAEGGSGVRVEGVTVGPSRERVEGRIVELLDEMAARLGGAAPAADRIHVHDGYIGEAYGLLTDASREAIELCARLEGLTLDPTYTGKAMGALIDHVRQGRYGPDDVVVFLHTGGAPVLFAYDEFVEGN